MTDEAGGGIPRHMWIVFRLLIAACVAIAKFSIRQTGVEETCTSDGISYVVTRRRNKRSVTATLFGVPFAQPLIFQLTRERAVDRWFKVKGFSCEFQSGDDSFDPKVYVACDHRALEAVLKSDAEARQAILGLLREGTKRIYTDGNHLWVHREGDTPPDANDIARLDQLDRSLSAVRAADYRILQDKFLWKAIVLESIAWGIAFYGVPALFETFSKVYPLYFNWGPILVWSLLMMAGVFAGLVALARYWLRGSSRAHLVFTESAIVLLIGVPISSVFLTSDLNTGFDAQPEMRVRAVVDSKYTTITTHKGHQTRHYHLALHSAASPEPVDLPQSLEVPLWIYNAATARNPVVLVLRHGALNVPWFERVEVPR